jgi:ABC-type branched-subunit amino acid transport system substrate-binding protein
MIVDLFPPQSTRPINWRAATSYEAAKALFNAISETAKIQCRFKRLIPQGAVCIRQNLLENLNIDQPSAVLVTVKDGSFVRN